MLIEINLTFTTMKNKVILFLFFIPISIVCYAQNIIDAIFENVIEIRDNNVITNGIDYLFTLSIPKTNTTPVIFISKEIPSYLLSDIYPEFSKIIVVTPNWKYYRESSGRRLSKGVLSVEFEPIASSVIYEFQRKNGISKKDSLVLMGYFPEMKFTEADKLNKDEMEVYYKEDYGSTCCPRDPQWDNDTSREEFITYFEKFNNVKITDTYVKSGGKEGEASYYYTLNGLSDELKLSFILERNYYRIINRAARKIRKIPKIYTPTIIDNSKMKKV